MIRITILLMMLLLIGLVMAADPIPWPMQPQGGTHNLYHSYGDYHRPWSEVTGADPGINFHFGVDLTDPTPDVENDAAEDVYCVRSGFVTWRDWMEENPDPPADHDNYAIVICDIEGQTTGYGWSYQHIEDRLYTTNRGNPWNVNDHFNLGARIGDIDNDASSQGGPGWTGDHLHFMRSAAFYDHNEPGYCNPLFYLDPEPVESAEFTWEWMCTPSHEYRFFAIPQYDALTEWGSHWVDLNACKTEIDDFSESISGAIDLVIWFVVNGTGLTGSISPRGCMPQQLEWWLERWDALSGQWVEVQDITGTPYRRYPFNFGDIELGGSSDWERYKQIYFRFSAVDFFGASGYMSCLTNCSDADDWNGIQNITENDWQTDVKLDLSGPTNNPALQLTRDGHYRVAIKPYAFNGINPPLALSTAYAELELHNSSPIVMSAEILDELKAIVWDAYWNAEETLGGLEAELVINANESVQLDQTLTATVVFSEPVNTSSIDITAGKPPYYNDLTVTTAGWSCTNNPEPYFDTWHGTIEIPAEGISGAIKLCIEGEDTDGNCLKDPAGVFTDEVDDYSDTYHGFGIAFSSEEGWPVFLSHWVNGSPVLGDFDGDGDLDVAVQCNDGSVQLIDETGLILRILESGDWSGFFSPLYSSPAIADIDLDGDMDVLAVHPYGCNAWDAETGSILSGWPVDMGDEPTITGAYPSRSAPAVCDLIGDEHPEVVICRHLDLTQPYAVCTVWMFDYQGGNRIWQRELEDGGVSVTSTPAVGDISSVHLGNEIVVCTSNGFVTNYLPPDDGKAFDSAIYLLDPADEGNNIWKTSFNCWFFASPVVTDIDGDGFNEVIVGSLLGSEGSRVFVLDGDYGTLEHTFSVNSSVVNSAGICDLNDDDILDIVAVDNTGHVYCWSGEDFASGNQYDPLPGFPLGLTGNPLLTSPSIADIDGDFDLEIVVGTDEGYLYAINSDGSICSGYPVTVPGLDDISGQPVIANLDNDSSLELMFADGSDSYAYCYDLGENSFPAEISWRQFQHDSWHTGCFAADNTIPEPPTNLTGTQTDGTVILEWDLSVNDFYSSMPEEPTDVVSYQIFRGFPPYDSSVVVGRVHSGVATYTDLYDPGVYPVVQYFVTASDGTNESEFSNDVRFHTRTLDVISLGCPVREEFSRGVSMRMPEQVGVLEESLHAERIDDLEGTVETVPSATDHAVSSGGNPSCLTDGSVEVFYLPSPGADAIIIDLGEECTVTSVLSDRMSYTSLDGSMQRDESVRTDGNVRVVKPYLLIEAAGSDGEFYPFADESPNRTETVRYIRIHGASGLFEVSVYGERESENTASSVEITRSAEGAGWLFTIPVMEGSEEADVQIFDISGRMIWSGHTESGSVLHWDGCTESRTPVPSGVYLLRCSVGSEVSTGSFVVRRD